MLSEIKFSYYQGIYTEESHALSKLRLEVPDEMLQSMPEKSSHLTLFR